MSNPVVDALTLAVGKLPADGVTFFADFEGDHLRAFAELKKIMPSLAAARAEVQEEFRTALPRAVVRKEGYDKLLKQAEDDAAALVRAKARADGAQANGPSPEHEVNVSFRTPFRYSLGTSDFRRGVYEKVRGQGGDPAAWHLRALLPHIHVRVIRRDGSRRRVDIEYLMSKDVDSPRVLIGDDELAEGLWARKLGMNLSGDRDIVTTAGTAIRDIAHRYSPEKEAVVTLDAHTATGQLDIPVPECLPAGYLMMPPGVTPAQAREKWLELVVILAERPKMALTLGASAGAPFNGPLHRPSHWWDGFGDSRTGKTTNQAVAAAVWGDPTINAGVVNGWDATSIGVGRHLGQLGIFPAFFDERGMAPYERSKWGEIIYQTCQGSSRLKAEVNSAQGTHKSPPWFGVMFTTGNHRLTDGISAGGFAGIPPRVIELSAPFTENQVEAERIAEILLDCYGWLGPAIVAANTVPKVRERLTLAAEMVGTPEGGAVPGTIAKHLHMAVAGVMMVDDVLGTGITLTEAALRAACEHLDLNAHDPEHDADRMVQALAESLTARRSAWPTMAEFGELNRPRPGFTADGKPEPRMVELAQRGYDQESSGVLSDDGDWLYVFPETWHQLADKLGTDRSVACAELHRRGHLHVAKSSRKRGEWQGIPTIGGKSTRVYQVSMDAIEIESETDDDDGTQTGVRPAEPDPELTLNTVPTAPAEVSSAEVPNPTPAPQPSAREIPDEAARGTVPADTGGHQTPSQPQQPVRRSAALMAASAALADGTPLRLLAALEGECAPTRQEGGRKRQPYWRPELPGITYTAHVVNSWQWDRPYEGQVAVLDRSGAFVAAASSVLVAHGALTHTGEVEFDNRPGYYQVQVHPWTEGAVLPHPLGEWASEQKTVWVPAPTVALLRDLTEEGRWPDVTVLDSYTGDGVRLSKWAGFVNELRAEAITEYGRESDQYLAVKTTFGQALSLMLGHSGDDGVRRTWKCKAARPDFTHAIQAQASAILYRWADDCRRVVPDLGPVSLRNVDELVIPQAALEVVTTTKRSGGRAPLGIDPDGIKLGTFKVKTAQTWGDR